MANWFECKVKYDKIQEKDLIKKVNEVYIVDALSFTEAEKRFLEEIEPFMSGDFEITDIRRARISELVESEDLQADRWYKAKVAFITIDEKTEKEKRAVQTFLIQSTDLQTALQQTIKAMEQTLGDWLVVSIAETKIMDVFKYKPAE